MLYKYKLHRLLSLSVFLIIILACKENDSATPVQETENSKTFTIEAKSYTGKNGSFIVDEAGRVIKNADEAGWLSYTIAVPSSGRYRVNLLATTKKDTVNCWVEDYIHNKDGRTYNITGNILVIGNQITSIEGSPMKQGEHEIKVHFGKGEIAVDKVSFTLLKEHMPSPVVHEQKTNGKEWKLTWSDEFNGKGLPDTSKWTYDFGNWGWGNNELQYYTANRIENARQEDGNLIIEARKNDDNKPWTSARLTTRGKASFLYGKIEFRAKVPVGRGVWSAGWLLGDAYVDELSWPYCGEVDILENVGYEIDSATGNGKTHASIHCGAYYFKLGNQPTSIAEVKNLGNEYHLYTAEWTPKGISMFIDGKKYFDYTDISSDLSWPYNNPQNIILNLAIGGGWGGAKGVDPLLTSQQFIIDYVRVYELQ